MDVDDTISDKCALALLVRYHVRMLFIVGGTGMEVEFVASVAIVTPDPARSRKLFVDTLRLPLEHAEGDDYSSTEKLGGSKHFGVWPLAQAAQACFGTAAWPSDKPVPQVSIEFELADEAAVARGATELQQHGYAVLHPVRTEPWGQTWPEY